MSYDSRRNEKNLPDVFQRLGRANSNPYPNNTWSNPKNVSGPKPADKRLGFNRYDNRNGYQNYQRKGDYDHHRNDNNYHNYARQRNYPDYDKILSLQKTLPSITYFPPSQNNMTNPTHDTHASSSTLVKKDDFTFVRNQPAAMPEDHPSFISFVKDANPMPYHYNAHMEQVNHPVIMPPHTPTPPNGHYSSSNSPYSYVASPTSEKNEEESLDAHSDRNILAKSIQIRQTVNKENDTGTRKVTVTNIRSVSPPSHRRRRSHSRDSSDDDSYHQKHKKSNKRNSSRSPSVRSSRSSSPVRDSRHHRKRDVSPGASSDEEHAPFVRQQPDFYTPNYKKRALPPQFRERKPIVVEKEKPKDLRAYPPLGTSPSINNRLVTPKKFSNSQPNSAKVVKTPATTSKATQSKTSKPTDKTTTAPVKNPGTASTDSVTANKATLVSTTASNTKTAKKVTAATAAQPKATIVIAATDGKTENALKTDLMANAPATTTRVSSPVTPITTQAKTSKGPPENTTLTENTAENEGPKLDIKTEEINPAKTEPASKIQKNDSGDNSSSSNVSTVPPPNGNMNADEHPTLPLSTQNSTTEPALLEKGPLTTTRAYQLEIDERDDIVIDVVRPTITTTESIVSLSKEPSNGESRITSDKEDSHMQDIQNNDKNDKPEVVQPIQTSQQLTEQQTSTMAANGKPQQNEIAPVIPQLDLLIQQLQQQPDIHPDVANHLLAINSALKQKESKQDTASSSLVIQQPVNNDIPLMKDSDAATSNNDAQTPPSQTPTDVTHVPAKRALDDSSTEPASPSTPAATTTANKKTKLVWQDFYKVKFGEDGELYYVNKKTGEVTTYRPELPKDV